MIFEVSIFSGNLYVIIFIDYIDCQSILLIMFIVLLSVICMFLK